MFKDFNLIDLTHVLDRSVPTWNGGCGFSYEIKMDYEQGLRAMAYRSHAGVGTHMDAPSHFIRGGTDIADIRLEKLIVPACVLDVRIKAHPDYLISVEDIKTYEERHGVVPKNSLIIGFTGWETRWKDVHQYRNPDEEGNMHFPGFSPEAAELLVKRDVAGIGIDTLSPDGSKNKKFPVHEIILGADKYILENLMNLEKLRVSGAYAIVLPLKVREGSECGVRAIGLNPKR